ncbi:MAG: tyrosine-type recombinase/integrase [Solirubrobacteraceae bacterium]
MSAWLYTKASRTESAATAQAYREGMTVFRALLRDQGLDLDSADERKIALTAQAFAEMRDGARTRRPGQKVAPGTYNQRLAIVSSFYDFARKRRYLTRLNPIETLDRKPDKAYQSAQPLDAREVAGRLAAIDRETLDGMRDYALLVVGLSTGRRLSELASLRWGSIEIAGGAITVLFHAKGGKVMRDKLTQPVSDALMRWVYRWHGAGVARLAPDAPVWVALERNARGHTLTARAISDVVTKRLGDTKERGQPRKTVKVHRLRHTFAHTMDAVGAPVSEIQARLGHSSLQTTGRYLASLRSAENPYADQVAAMLGIK